MRQARFHIAWTWVDSAPHDTWHFAGVDTQFSYLTDPEVDCEVYANLYSCTRGTSTRFDSANLDPAPGAPDTPLPAAQPVRAGGFRFKLLGAVRREDSAAL